MRLDPDDKDLILPPLLAAAAAASGFSIAQIKSESRHEPLPFVRYVLFVILHAIWMGYHKNRKSLEPRSRIGPGGYQEIPCHYGW